MSEFPETLGVVVLAAGRSTRFGPENKLLVPINGKPIASRAFDLAAGVAADQALAVISDPAVAALARASGLEVVEIAPGAPQSESLRAGLMALRPAITGVLILLADMPWVTLEDLRALISKGLPACAVCGEQPMPPVLLPRAWWEDAHALSGDRGARDWLRRITASQRVSLPADHLRDIDRPEDIG